MMLQIYAFISNKLAKRGNIILCLSLMLMAQSTLFAQDKARITISDKNITVIEALKSVEKQSDMPIGYNDSQLKDKAPLSLDLKEADLEHALTAILKGSGYTWQLKGNYIMIVPDAANGREDNQKKITITGQVLDASGFPVPGAAVIEKSTSQGTVTDIDGKFTLTVAGKGSMLEVNCLGYLPYSCTVGDSANYVIELQEDTITLEATVVTALGIKRSEKALSYNVQEVDSEELLRSKDANFVNSLNGKIAGVTINKSSSGAGGATRVVMRGSKSIEGNNGVLYVVDGIPLVNTSLGSGNDVKGSARATTEGIADFNPEDIESISVLSGPSAAALYGASAANGVVIITTKKGQEGKLQISFSSTSEFSDAYMTPSFQNIYGNNPGVFDSWSVNELSVPSSYDPKKDFFQTGMNFINSLTLTNGNSNNQTFASISSTNSQGIVPNNKYDRLNFTIRNTSNFFNDRVKLDLGASLVHQTDQNMVSQGLYQNPIVAAYLFPRGESWDAVRVFERYDSSRGFNTQYWPIKDGDYATDNPYWTAYRYLTPSNKNRYMFNAGLTFKITDWMDITARYRIDDSHIKFERKIYASTDELFTEGSSKGLYEWNNFMDRQQYADALLNINKTLGDFNISANLGYSYSDYTSATKGYGGPLKLVPNLFSFGNIDSSKATSVEDGGYSNWRNNAVFANVEAGWRNMLFLTLTGRIDWNSRLVNTKQPYSPYPSVGLSAVISEMVKLPEWFSYLKVRGSYAVVGAPISRSGLTLGTLTTPIVGGVIDDEGIYPFTDFKPEETRSYEFGLEFRLWHGLRAQVTYYNSNTFNQTFLGKLPEYSGYKQIYLQAGNVQNRGWEASLGYGNDFKNGLSFSSNLIFSRNVNEIKQMVENYKTDMSLEPINIPEVLKDGGRTILKVGGSVHDIYANQFLKKDAQGYVHVDGSGKMSIETTDPVYLGKTTPDFTLGWNNSLSYKGFGLSFMINGRFGGVVTSSTEAILDRFGVSKASAEARRAGGFMIPNQGMVDAKSYYQLIGTGNYGTSGYYVYSATNIRLQEVTLSYTFPNRWFNDVLKDLTLAFTANNPWMIYCQAPFDPELTPSTGTYGQGNDYFMQPSVRSYAVSVKFKF